jgi:trimethylamine--corrinoid protein Co-methyltransferase
VKPGGHYLNQKHTVKWFRREHFYPSPIIDRQNLRDWLKEGGKDILQRAKVEVRKILRKHKPQPLPPDIERELDKTLRNLLKACGMEGMLKNLMIMR